MTKFIAHRGYSKYQKENTLPAFKLAGKCEYFYGIETDVHKTTDNKYIILHDETLERVTDGRSLLNVEESIYDDVKKVIISDLDGSTTNNELFVPLAYEYFDICRDANKVAVCELKQAFSIEEIKEILEMVKEHKMIENTMFISFNIDNLIKVRELNKDIPLEFLFGEFKDEYYDLLVKYNLGIDGWCKNVDKNLINFCKKHNLSTNAWTVDDKEEAKRLINLGIDFITSNALNINDMND